MKVRTDYVSNSSSSSFVFANTDEFEFFNVTKEDILNALVDAYGAKDYKAAKTSRLKASKEHPDWHEDELKWGSFGPFYVYDLADKNDRKEAIERWGELLSGWTATSCRRLRKPKNGVDVELNGDCIRQYVTALEAIAEIYDCQRHDLEDVASGQNSRMYKRFVRSDKKDPKTGMYGHYERMPSELVATVRNLRAEAGVMTNLDVIKSKCARFFVHADDNELCGGKFGEYGRDEDHSWNKDAKKMDWETESGSFDRVCEVVYNYLVKTGRIVPDDPRFLESMRIGDKYLSKSDKDSGEVYDFCNGRSMTWKDIRHSSLTWNMHEG